VANTSGSIWQEVDDALNDALGPIIRARQALFSLSGMYTSAGESSAEIDKFLSDVDALQTECARIRNDAGDLADKMVI